MTDGFNFDDSEFSSFEQAALESMAAAMATLFKAFKKQGLSAQEAAALTAAYASQIIPEDPKGPTDGS